MTIIKNEFKALLIFMLFSTTLFGQPMSIRTTPISVSYYGDNVFHPGIKFATYLTFWSQEKSKNYHCSKRSKKYGMKRTFKELNVDLNIGGYSHPNSHNGYFVNTGLTFIRTQLRKNRQIGTCFEIGYLRRNNKFTTYELNSNDEIQEVKGAGNNALLIGVSPLLSQEFSISQRLVRFYAKPTFQLVHYVYRFQPNAALEVGAVFNIHRKKRDS